MHPAHGWFHFETMICAKKLTLIVPRCNWRWATMIAIPVGIGHHPNPLSLFWMSWTIQGQPQRKRRASPKRRKWPSLPRTSVLGSPRRSWKRVRTFSWHGAWGYLRWVINIKMVIYDGFCFPCATYSPISIDLFVLLLNYVSHISLRIDCNAAKGAKVIMPIRPVAIWKHQLEVNEESVCLVWVLWEPSEADWF